MSFKAGVNPVKGDIVHRKALYDFYVVFGEVHNPEIITVETKGHEEELFEETEILEYEGKRYYFHIGREPIVRGLSESGEVIDRQGG